MNRMERVGENGPRDDGQADEFVERLIERYLKSSHKKEVQELIDRLVPDR